MNLPLVDKSQDSKALPLVINVVSKYWGEDLIPAPVQDDLKSGQEIKGTVIMAGVKFVEKRGFASFFYRGSIGDLKKRIDQGIPPIVIMPGIKDMVQHATIVSGYNGEERRILTYVPEPDTIGAVPEAKFQQDWIQDDLTTIVILPSDMKDLLAKEKLQSSESLRSCFEAEQLWQLGRREEAISELNSATGQDPNNAQAWCILGSIYNDIGSWDSASKCLEKAISLNPNYYLAYRGLGNLYMKIKDYCLAEAYYTKAINVNPVRFAPIYKNRAFARLQLSKEQEAKQDLIKYLEQLPDSADRKSIEDALVQM